MTPFPTRFLLAPVLAGALLVSLPLSPAHAQIPPPSLSAGAPITVLVDGRPVNFAGSPPQSVGGRLLVPLRAIFEALGATVDFSGALCRVRPGVSWTLHAGKTLKFRTFGLKFHCIGI